MAKKRRRNAKTSVADDIVKIAAALPWWAGVVLAGSSFVILRWLATREVVLVPDVRETASMVGSQLVHVLAGAGQYLLPVLFMIGAVSSFAASRKQAVVSPADLPAAGGESGAPARRAPSLASANVDRVSDTFAGTLSQTPPHETAQGRPNKLDLELLRAIDWRRFEEVCAEYFRLCGFHATTQSHGADGGIDIRLYAPNDHLKLVNIVQCKQWGRAVGPKALRELLGVMTASKIARGTFVAASTFNEEASQFAQENKIHLIDGAGFIEKMLIRPAADQQRLLEVATEGDYLVPSCPSCGVKLVKRENKKDKSEFWGCAHFPRCRYTLQM